MNRNLTIILIGTALLALIGGLLWWWSLIQQREGSLTTTTDQGVFNSGTAPSTSNGIFGEDGAIIFEEDQDFTVTPDAQTDTQISLRRIYDAPIAGGAVHTNTDGSSNIHFVERSTGHIYEYSLTNDTTTRLSNVTIPKIQEALFSNNARVAYLRYTDEPNTITTLRIPVPTTPDTTGEFSGDFLAQNIHHLSTSALSDNAIGLITDSVSTKAYLLSSGEITSTLLDTPISGWQTSLLTNSLSTFTQNAAAEFSGHAYSLDSQNGSVTPITSNIRGLTTLTNPTNNYTLASETTNTGFQTFYIDHQTGDEILTPFTTLPEKCVWSRLKTDRIFCAVPNSISPATYPDAWYRSEVDFKDTLFFYDIDTQELTLLANLSRTFSQPTDATNLHLSLDENHILFTDKPTQIPYVFTQNALE